ncbi:MAG TPA: histidine phosphatase family protein [Thermoanaerobaculia bacterium]
MTEQLILVRHGETVDNVARIAQGWGDSDLSDRGQLQVARLAERLKSFAPDALFSSPLNRALTTAQKISDATGLTVNIVDELREMNYGRWEGQSFLEVRKVDEDNYRRWIDDPDFPCPEGESHSAVLERVRRALEQINGSKRPILVTHGTAIRIATTALLALPLSASRNFAQDNAAVNVFVRRGDRWVLKLWNDTTHCEQS